MSLRHKKDAFQKEKHPLGVYYGNKKDATKEKQPFVTSDLE
jgi:hypothetical protein